MNIGLSNIQYAKDEKTLKKLEDGKEIIARFETAEIPKEWLDVDMTKPIELTINTKANKRIMKYIKLERFKSEYYKHLQERNDNYWLGDRE